MRGLVRVVLVVFPLALCLALPLTAYLRGRASGSSFGANSGDQALMSALTWAVLDLMLLVPLLLVNRLALQVVVPPLLATAVVGTAWLVSGPSRGGVLDARLIDLLNLPAYLVMNAVNHVGGRAAETSAGLTFSEARAAGFSTSFGSVAAVGDGAVVVGCVGLHQHGPPLKGRVFGLDARGQLRSTFGEQLDLTCDERLVAASPTRTALLPRHDDFGIGSLRLVGAQESMGPDIVGSTALALTAAGEAWVAHRASSGGPKGTLVSRVKNGWPNTVLVLDPLEGTTLGPRVLALRANADGSGVLVAVTSSQLVRTEFSEAGVQRQVPLVGEGAVVAAGLDAAGRVVVHRSGAGPSWVRYLPDGTVDGAFAAPADLLASALGVADDGAVWLISRRNGGDVVLRLRPDGRLDPAVSFEAAVSRR